MTQKVLSIVAAIGIIYIEVAAATYKPDFYSAAIFAIVFMSAVNVTSVVLPAKHMAFYLEYPQWYSSTISALEIAMSVVAILFLSEVIGNIYALTCIAVLIKRYLITIYMQGVS